MQLSICRKFFTLQLFYFWHAGLERLVSGLYKYCSSLRGHWPQQMGDMRVQDACVEVVKL